MQLHWYDSAGCAPPSLLLAGARALTFSNGASRRNTAYFSSYLEDSYKTLNKPIWLTEVPRPLSLLSSDPLASVLTIRSDLSQFMGTGTPAEQKTFLEFAVPYLEKQAWVERYAAFGASRCRSFPLARTLD